jgi:colanic acid/amylovoran biosynthesis glycosyltransferase
VKRRIALVLSAFPQVSETFIVSKFLGLLERGWDVHVVCNRSEAKHRAHFPHLTEVEGALSRIHTSWPHGPRWKAALLAPLGVLRCLVRAPVRTWRYLSRGVRRFGLAGTLHKLYIDADLVLLGPELVHFEFGSLAPARMYLADLLGCRITVSFRGYDLNYVGLEHPYHYEPVWSGASGLHLLGEDLWKRARQRGCPEDRFHVLIPPAVDADFFRPDAMAASRRQNGGQPLRILSVGRLEWKKGYEDALLAIRRLVDQGLQVRYRIVGDGEYLGAVAFIRYQLGLEDTVELLGAQPREVVRGEMHGADVLLHAAVSEGFCNAVMEAQAMELPVVCTDADGLSENVADGETGFVVPRRDPAALAEKLKLVLGDAGLRARLGAAGRRRVLEKFRLAEQLGRFERFYESVLDGGDSSGAGRPRAS